MPSDGAMRSIAKLLDDAEDPMTVRDWLDFERACRALSAKANSPASVARWDALALKAAIRASALEKGMVVP